MASKEFSDRLKKLRKLAGYSQKEVYEHFNIPQSTFSSWEVGKSEPSGEMLIQLCEFYKCDMMKEFSDINKDMVTNVDLSLLEKYHALDDHGKEMVDFTLEKETDRIKKYGKLPDEPNKIVKFPKRLISYYFKNASAGTGQIVIDNLPDKDIEIPDKPEYKNVSYAIGVNGSSMEPAFHDGDILLVEATREIEIGDIGIFQIDNECFVKKLGETSLISLNKDYKDIPLNETAITLGKVIDTLNS